jgi:lipopolysaccharide transport system ATP-binding protein
MSDTIIKVENLGKKYTISHEGRESYTALRDVVSNNIKSLFRSKQQRLITGEEEEFWALKDINFEIKQGDAVGIIGRNGAGKSTLLKILSRITEPSTGRITLNGRVASLLEVGTGFHPELTGRENIYLNGAILGMSRAEIKHKFDEIVDFSGVEKFLDTPVKRYSSGMYVRLAFAVAAHLEPEILVVDEVLAVGDAEFQKKCLGKMNDVSQKEGRTVLFVSHNMGAISALCNNAILLNSGRIEKFGSTGNIISAYFSNANNSSYYFDSQDTIKKYADETVELLSGYVQDENGEMRGRFNIDEGLTICMKYRIKQTLDVKVVPNFHFYNTQGECIFVCSAVDVQPVAEGAYESYCEIPPNFLNDGVHFITMAMTTYDATGYKVNFFYKDAISFEILDKLHDNPLRYNYSGVMTGYIRPKLDFYVRKTEWNKMPV